MLWYSLIVIDNWICKKPLELPLQQLSTLLLQAFQFHFQLNNKEAYTKIAVAYCGITRWTFGTNTACKEVIELTKKQETIDMGIFLLGIMAEEYRVIPKKAHIPSERIQQLKQIFENESVEVIEILVALIMNNRIDAIYTLIKYIGWVKTPILMNCGVFNLLDKTMMITDMLKPTLECLTEYLQTNTIPSEPQFHLSLLRLALNTIKQKNIPTHSALLLLMKTFEICLQRIPLDDSLLEIPRILNQFLNVQSDFTIISLCFEAWNVFLDTTIAESLCIAEEFIPIAQECCTQILKLLFNSTYSGIQMLDTSKIGNESSEYDLFVFSAYQVLLFLIDFQTVTILPIITNVISMSFNHLFNKNLNQFTDGDVCDLATTCRLFFEVSPNIVRNIYSLDQLQNTYQPLFNVLELIPFITNEMVIDVSRYLCASLRSLFPILHDLKSIQTSQYISQIVLKLLQIIEKCTITEVGKNIIELLTELMLSCRPEIYQIDIIMEILNNTIQFSNKYQFPFKNISFVL
ncbi:Exportin-1/Importin-beta-like domain-containing protein [Entamoeba marina]